MRGYKKITKETLQDFVNESVVSLANARAKKDLQRFEVAIRPFIHFWGDGLDALLHVEISADDPDAQILAHLMKEFRDAGKNLSVFLRGRRLRMMKEKK